MPYRLNREPIIFMGMTDSELKLAGCVSLAFFIPISFIILWIIGSLFSFEYMLLKSLFLGIVIGTLLSFASLWMLGKVLTRIKRGKPDGYHILWIIAWLEDHDIKRKTMIRESRVWGLNRS